MIRAGEEFIDQVALSNNLVIPQQSIGAAEFAIGFDGVDGILGFVCASLVVELNN